MADELILLVSDADALGGAERYLVALARTGSQLGRRFAALVRSPALAEALREVGAATEVQPTLGRRPDPRVVRAVRRAVGTHRPDVLLVNLTDQGDNAAGLVAAGLLRCRVTTAAVLHLWVPGGPRWRRPYYATTLRMPQRLLTPGSGTAGDLRALGLRATVIPNGLEPTEQVSREEARRALGIEPSSVAVGGVGRLVEQKGWDVLSEAWPQVAARHPRATMTVIGEGADRGALEARGSGVRFVGEIPGAARLLSAFDLLVVPSRFEAHALVPIEAAMAGVPAIVSDVPGLREAAGPATLLVPPDLSGRLAEVMDNALDDLDRLAGVARAETGRAIRRYDPSAMATRTFAALGC